MTTTDLYRRVRRLLWLAWMTMSAIGCGSSSGPAVVVYFFQDAHELAPVDKGRRGGVARIATLIERERERNACVMTVFGGDLVGGSLLGEFRGAPVVEAMNAIDLDYANFGQHEFDYGIDVTRARIRQSEFRWFTSNLIDRAGKPFMAVPSRVMHACGGVKVGLFGITGAMETTHPGHSLVSKDTMTAAGEEVRRLKAEGADVIIGVTQQTPSEDERLAKRVPGIDVIFGEEIAETSSRVDTVRKTTIARSAGNVSSVVRLTIERGPRPLLAFSLIPVDPSIPSDPRITKIERHYDRMLDRILREPVGTLPVALDARVELNRAGETVVGNLVSDSLRKACGADVALFNAGALRADRVFPAGPLTQRSLREMIPFDDEVVVFEVLGKTLRDTLEHGVSAVESKSGRFLHVSGMRYRFDPVAPAGARVQSVFVNDKPLAANEFYWVATRGYLARGGDGFDMLAKFRTKERRCGATEVAAVEQYLKANRNLRPKLEGRIVVP